MESTPATAQAGRPAWVVGIGASAGGLESLQALVARLEPGTGCAFVVLQHLAPSHASLLVDLLTRSTGLHVVEATDDAQLVADVIFVCPPNRDVTVLAGKLRLAEPAQRLTPTPSIDKFFESLAEQWQQRSVAVILSGTGSDGAVGMRAVKGAGGITMAQSPQDARFDAMPRAAVALGGAEILADASVLGEWLNDLGKHPPVSAPHLPHPTEARSIDNIADQLKRSIGIDFSGYKEATLRRQIQRRMAVRQVKDMAEYLDIVSGDSEEAHALSSNLLVTVTSFFRGTKSFEALREAIENLIADHTDQPLRVWVPGCASGEEVYSIAMIIGEALGYPADLDRRLKIFGTDLDEVGLAAGRRAVYPESALAQIPEKFHAHYLRMVTGGFSIADVLRECVVFARHDVSLDAPFSRLDLISCRNTFIYFTPPLQEQVLSLFAFGLNPGGLLFLGEAETLEASSPFFSVVDKKARIFTRTSERIGPVGPFNAMREWSPEQPGAHARPDLGQAGAAIERQVALLEVLVGVSGQAYLVMDAAQNLVQVVGDVSAYCKVPEGRITPRADAFLRPELREDARSLLLLADAAEQPPASPRIRLRDPDTVVQMQARRIQVDGLTFTVLAFLPVPDEPAPQTGGAISDARLAQMERELRASQESLRRSLAELQIKNEELEASSEELQAASEELQASNEELQASNEELQAANEELVTLNVELRQRSDEFKRMNTDLENIQASSNQGMVIVDRDLRVLRFTPLAVRLFALVESDVGSPLLAAPTTLDTAGLEDALRRVVGGEDRATLRVGDTDISYLLQVVPYRAMDDQILGAIVTLTDVTQLDTLRRTAESAVAELEAKSDLLEHQAAHDFVTGLLNRGYFTEILEREMARADREEGRIALGWVDVDRFKETNDEYGHDAGDEVLRTLGERLLQAVRASDFVGRIGGDEFGVIVAGYHHLAELDAVLDRLVAAMRTPIEVDGQETRVAGSVGVAIYPGDAVGVETLMRAADTAMYEVKHRGGDSYGYFSPEMQAVATERRRMRAEIAQSLGRDKFELHYQPIVDATENVTVAVESLLRWHRDGELVPAAEFVPFCEKSGQIRPLGMETLGLLRRDTEQLRQAGFSDLLITFNMSVSQLEDPRFIELLDTWPVPGGLRGIVVEVVESIFLPDHHVAMQTLRRLTDLGAQTAIDDYGAGYSNARALEALSPAFIKLDKSYLSDRHTAGARMALIKSAVEVAHAVGSKVIAEGVEDAEQREMLQECGANYLQGYGIVGPMTLPQTLEWLSATG